MYAEAIMFPLLTVKEGIPVLPLPGNPFTNLVKLIPLSVDLLTPL